MKKVLLWGMGVCFNKNIALVRMSEIKGLFRVVGVTSNVRAYASYGGYSYVKKEDLNSLDFDVVIIMAEGKVSDSIRQEALAMGVPQECIWNYHVLMLRGFDVEKYLELRRNPPTIFAVNCWGGFTYHSVGLEFSSPLINLFMSQEDYLKLLNRPQYYMSRQLELESMGYSEVLGRDYPVVRCDDLLIHFNHYHSFEEALKCWERRKNRINWGHLFIMMHTNREDLAEEFLKLPYEKKVCFVPFESNEKELVCPELLKDEEMRKMPFGEIVNGMARGNFLYYDVLDLLLLGEITQVENVRVS